MHRAAGRRRAERVLDEVGHDLEHPVRVADRPRLFVGQRLEVYSAGAGLTLVAPHCLASHFRKVDLLAVDGELPPVHARQVEQVAYEALEPARFLTDRRSRLLGRHRAVLERFGVPADRG